MPEALISTIFAIIYCIKLARVTEPVKAQGTNFHKVHNIRRYLLTCILNAPTTITNVTLAQCRNDMPWLVQKRGA